jgi:acyl dehydratase
MPEPRVFNGVDSVQAAVGEHLGYSDWLEITQERVNTFAEATGDFQWIHVDVERAKSGPFGGTIAHGYLTLSMASFFLPQIARYEGFALAVNYGVDKVRFIAPVLVGKRIRAGAEMMEVTDVKGGGVQTKVLITIEIEGSEKPACVIESISRWIP